MVDDDTCRLLYVANRWMSETAWILQIPKFKISERSAICVAVFVSKYFVLKSLTVLQKE